jgi:hypothetical protein
VIVINIKSFFPRVPSLPWSVFLILSFFNALSHWPFHHTASCTSSLIHHSLPPF